MNNALHLSMKNVYYLYSYEFLLLALARRILFCTQFLLNSNDRDVKREISRSVVSGILILDDSIFAPVIPARRDAAAPTASLPTRRPAEIWIHYRARKRILNSVY